MKPQGTEERAWGHYSGAPLYLIAHKPGLTCRSVWEGTICYLHPSSGNPVSILRKEKFHLLFCKMIQAWLCPSLPSGGCSPPGIRKHGAPCQISCTQRIKPPTAAERFLLYRNSSLGSQSIPGGRYCAPSCSEEGLFQPRSEPPSQGARSRTSSSDHKFSAHSWHDVPKGLLVPFTLCWQRFCL